MRIHNGVNQMAGREIITVCITLAPVPTFCFAIPPAVIYPKRRAVSSRPYLEGILSPLSW